MSVKEHKREAPPSVSCKVITVSDTRTKETDKSGILMIELLQANGHQVLEYAIVKDEEAEISTAIDAGLENPHIRAILINGGTGIAERDVTVEVVQRKIRKEINGFGELFRYLSYVEDIGSAAIMSRALAGTHHGKVIFSTPGSSGAVKLAMEKLILPELGHVIRELDKDLK